MNKMCKVICNDNDKEVEADITNNYLKADPVVAIAGNKLQSKL